MPLSVEYYQHDDVREGESSKVPQKKITIGRRKFPSLVPTSLNTRPPSGNFPVFQELCNLLKILYSSSVWCQLHLRHSDCEAGDTGGRSCQVPSSMDPRRFLSKSRSSTTESFEVWTQSRESEAEAEGGDQSSGEAQHLIPAHARSGGGGTSRKCPRQNSS